MYVFVFLYVSGYKCIVMRVVFINYYDILFNFYILYL